MRCATLLLLLLPALFLPACGGECELLAWPEAVEPRIVQLHGLQVEPGGRCEAAPGAIPPALFDAGAVSGELEHGVATGYRVGLEVDDDGGALGVTRLRVDVVRPEEWPGIQTSWSVPLTVAGRARSGDGLHAFVVAELVGTDAADAMVAPGGSLAELLEHRSITLSLTLQGPGGDAAPVSHELEICNRCTDPDPESPILEICPGFRGCSAAQPDGFVCEG